MSSNQDVTQWDMRNGIDPNFTTYHGCANCNSCFPAADVLCPSLIDATSASTNTPSLQAGDYGWGGFFSGQIAGDETRLMSTVRDGIGRKEQGDGTAHGSRPSGHADSLEARTAMQEAVPQIISEIVPKVMAQIEDQIREKIKDQFEMQLADLNTRMQDDTARFSQETNENIQKLKVWSDRLELFVTKLLRQQ
ncbi:uncharacterized protein F4822DRAFT_435463 [Hypoxylon trugodes]|uniref:uncharacterized protein n=1 Tax=Hypoxylon trugodes TaxID=326681 RepID=UPI002195D6EA|nr:uncharacterized protein F4822DRAFT_435463 [Hypoxylon trugodes]KAI1382551.1 hypothetical protein F4822DRAFT_435463 [Hypoxylon trugodes]